MPVAALCRWYQMGEIAYTGPGQGPDPIDGEEESLLMVTHNATLSNLF